MVEKRLRTTDKESVTS